VLSQLFNHKEAFMNEFGEYIRYMRERHGLTQETLAVEAGVAPNTIQGWEKGRRPQPSLRLKIKQYFAQLEHERETHSVRKTIIDPYIPEPVRLVGREMLVTQLVDYFSWHPRALISLHGMGGIGKTSLAITLAHHQTIRKTFDVLLWASPGQSFDIFKIFHRWGKLLGLSGTHIGTLKDEEAWRAALRTEILELSVLMFLDGVWSPEAFSLLLPGSASLITARNETLVNFHHMRFAVPRLSYEESRALLSFEWTGKRAVTWGKEINEKVERLVSISQGHPFVLRLMGGYLHQQKQHQIKPAMDQLNDPVFRLTRLGERFRESPEIEQTLASCIALSVERLTAPQRFSLYRLSCHSDEPLSQEAALALAQSDTETLSTLAHQTLLEMGDDGRYHLHQLISDYCQLHQNDQFRHETEKTFFRYIHGFVETHAHDYEHLEKELPLIISVINRAQVSEAIASEEVIALLLLLIPFLLEIGMNQRVLEYIHYWKRQASGLERTWFLLREGQALSPFDRAAAEECFEKALVQLERYPDELFLHWLLLLFQARVLARHGMIEASIQVAKKAYQFAVLLGENSPAFYRTIVSLCWLYSRWQPGERAESIRILQVLLPKLQDFLKSSPENTIWKTITYMALCNLAADLILEGNIELPETLLEEAEKLAVQLRSVEKEVELSITKGTLFLARMRAGKGTGTTLHQAGTIFGRAARNAQKSLQYFDQCIASLYQAYTFHLQNENVSDDRLHETIHLARQHGLLPYLQNLVVLSRWTDFDQWFQQALKNSTLDVF
jgi:DNA-binding XRE family transcriptional regulator